MSPDNFQQAWQAHSSQTRVTIDADLLLKEVQRNQREFRATIFWRDFREVAVPLLLIPLWFYLGARTSSPWTWYLTVPALIWVAAFFVVDRIRHPQKPSEPGQPLLETVKESLIQVEHQIWLLRNILWWYILPPAISISAFFAHVAWLSAIESNDWWEALGAAAFLFVFLFGVYAFIYYLNQRAVRVQLEPRRQELLTLLASLGAESNGEGPNDHVNLPALPFVGERFQASCNSPARIAISMVAFVVGMLILVAIVKVITDTDPYVLTGEGYPKRSPFAAVRWQQYQPEVKLGEEWFKLVSLNELPASEIVSFSRRTYGDLWRKRFEQDLVELLTGMGHPPQGTVTLVVQSPASSETQVREDVPMTYANRRAIRQAAQARERAALQSP